MHTKSTEAMNEPAKTAEEAQQSVWLFSAVSAPETVPLDGDIDCEVAVVGAGFTGLNAALRLAKEGRSTVVLEQGGVGDGASGRNGGQVVPGLKHDPKALLRIGGSARGKALVDFAGSAADRTFELIKTNQLNCDARQTGWLQPAVTQSQLTVIRRRAEEWRRYGRVDALVLDSEEVKAATGTDAYIGGWIDPRGGVLQPLSYARELARSAIAKGARVHTESPVEHLSKTCGKWQLRSRSGNVTARQVVLATNGYRQSLLPALNQSIIPSHSAQIATEPLEPEIRRSIFPAGLPVSDSRRLLKYMRFDRDGRFIIGGRGSFGDKDSGRHFAELFRLALQMFPQLDGVRWAHRWAGKIALTLDHLPHIHNPEEGLYAALGYNGRGVAMASQTGILLADLCMGLPHRDSPLPVTSIRRIPLHALRRPALEAAVLWYRILDRMGR